MNRRKIFAEIAELYSLPVGELDHWQRNITRHGICYAYQRISLREDGQAYANSEYSNEFLTFYNHCHIFLDGCTYLCDVLPKNRKYRSAFCLLLATFTNKEYAEVVKGWREARKACRLI